MGNCMKRNQLQARVTHTMPATEGSRWLYSSAVTAPMERPHSPMVLVLPAIGRRLREYSSDPMMQVVMVQVAAPMEQSVAPQPNGARAACSSAVERGRSGSNASKSIPNVWFAAELRVPNTPRLPLCPARVGHMLTTPVKQDPIIRVLHPPSSRRYATTASRSSTSCAPSVTYPPSDRPEPCRHGGEEEEEEKEVTARGVACGPHGDRVWPAGWAVHDALQTAAVHRPGQVCGAKRHCNKRAPVGLMMHHCIRAGPQLTTQPTCKAKAGMASHWAARRARNRPQGQQDVTLP